MAGEAQGRGSLQRRHRPAGAAVSVLFHRLEMGRGAGSGDPFGIPEGGIRLLEDAGGGQTGKRVRGGFPVLCGNQGGHGGISGGTGAESPVRL